MCLLVFAWKSHPRYRLIFAGNRDEFHRRPAAAADWWQDSPDLLAGRDLEAGGTWLGVGRTGRFSVITNYREIQPAPEGAPSRGRLIPQFTGSADSPEKFLEELLIEGRRYPGFNMVFGDAGGLHYYSNRGDLESPLAAGIHGLSNHHLDTPWPKVERVKQELTELLRDDDPEDEALLEILADRQPAPDELLPDTGVGLQFERLLSAPFIVSPEYGTRCSTIIKISNENELTFVERSFDSRGEGTGTIRFCFDARSDGRKDSL